MDQEIEDAKEFFSAHKFFTLVAVLVVIIVVGLIGFRMTCVTFIDNYEFGFSYDKLTGKIEKIDRSGWIVRPPFIYSIHGIDMRPYQVSISANQRILNAKLVRFNPEGLDKFVEWHGRDAGDDLYTMLEILKCYAFDRAEGRDCPFLTVISELDTPQGIFPENKG
jgi:hypothetical protein